MTVAELFVNIGLKGADKTTKGLSNIGKELKDVSNAGLATKAALLGVFVGLERLTGWASQIGMDMTKFTTVTGISAQELQKWTYAANRYDVSAEEMMTTIKGVSAAMADMRLGKGAPESLGILAKYVGFDQKKADDTLYVISKIQEFIKSGAASPAIVNQLTKAFGISENVFQMLANMSLEKDKLSQSQFITDSEISRLTNVNKQWKDLWYTIRTIGIKLVASEGAIAVNQLAKAFQFLGSTATAISRLLNEFKTLKTVLMVVGAAIAAYFAPITATIAGITLLLGEFQKKREGASNLIDDVVNFFTPKKQYGPMTEEQTKKQQYDREYHGFLKNWLPSFLTGENKEEPSVAEQVKPVKPASVIRQTEQKMANEDLVTKLSTEMNTDNSRTNQNNTSSYTVNIYGTDTNKATDVGDAVKQILNARNQSPARLQRN